MTAVLFDPVFDEVFDKCAMTVQTWAFSVGRMFLFARTSCNGIYTCGAWEATQSGFTAKSFLSFLFSLLVYT